MLEQNDLEQIRSIIDHRTADQRARTRRYIHRWLIIGGTVGLLWFLGDAYRLHELTRGWEFIAPVIIDKFVFGAA